MRRRAKRIVVTVVVVLGLLVVGVVVAGVAIVGGPRNAMGMLRYDSRAEGSFRVGDRAPDVELLSLDGSVAHLRDRFGARPTVLIFGSFT